MSQGSVIKVVPPISHSVEFAHGALTGHNPDRGDGHALIPQLATTSCASPGVIRTVALTGRAPGRIDNRHIRSDFSGACFCELHETLKKHQTLRNSLHRREGPRTSLEKTVFEMSFFLEIRVLCTC
jgi:hypothetical protein